MVEIARRKLIGGGIVVVVGGLSAAVALRDDISILIRHEFDQTLHVEIDVTHPDTGNFEHKGAKQIRPSETASVEFVDTDMGEVKVQVVSERGSGSYLWSADSDLNAVVTDSGVEFDV